MSKGPLRCHKCYEVLYAGDCVLLEEASGFVFCDPECYVAWLEDQGRVRQVELDRADTADEDDEEDEEDA